MIKLTLKKKKNMDHIFIFLMWTIFKVFTEFVTILLLFYVLFIGLKACGLLAPSFFSFLHYSICGLVL